MTTLKDIANHLGLSRATVSRALNGYPEVNEETKRRVAEAAQLLAYSPNLNARKLATGRTGLIATVVHAGEGEVIELNQSNFFVGLSQALSKKELDLVLHLAASDEPISFYERIARRGSADALLLNGPTVDDARIQFLLDRDIPFVVHGKDLSKRKYAYYDMNNSESFVDATRYLLDLGHRRIAFINGFPNASYAVERLRGYRFAMGDLGVNVPDRFVLHTASSVTEGQRVAAQWLAEPPALRPTAILCTSSIQAFGVYQAARDAGVKIGAELSVLSHDDVMPHWNTQTYDPPLTVSRKPISDACQPIADLIEAVVAGEDPAKLRIIEKAELVVRASTRPVKTGMDKSWP